MRTRSPPSVISSSDIFDWETRSMRAFSLVSSIRPPKASRLTRLGGSAGEIQPAHDLQGRQDLHEADIHARRRADGEGDRVGDVFGLQRLVAVIEALVGLLGVTEQAGKPPRTPARPPVPLPTHTPTARNNPHVLVPRVN